MIKAAGPVTERERAIARQMNADRGAVERQGICAATLIGSRLQRAVIAAVRAGRDPVPVLGDHLVEATPILTRAMLAAYLKGLRRGVILAPKRPPLALGRDPYSGMMEALKKRLAMSPEEVWELEHVLHGISSLAMKRLSDNLFQDLRAAILPPEEIGIHVKGGVERVQRFFEANGLTPNNSFTFEAIFRTQTQLAYGAGRWKIDQDEAVQEILWGYKYLTVGDDRVRDTHIGFEGVTLPKEDPFWEVNWPPNGWACRCVAIPIFEAEEIVRAPELVDVDGKQVRPEADKGFRFNPGQTWRVAA